MNCKYSTHVLLELERTGGGLAVKRIYRGQGDVVGKAPGIPLTNSEPFAITTTNANTTPRGSRVPKKTGKEGKATSTPLLSHEERGVLS